MDECGFDWWLENGICLLVKSCLVMEFPFVVIKFHTTFIYDDYHLQ